MAMTQRGLPSRRRTCSRAARSREISAARGAIPKTRQMPAEALLQEGVQFVQLADVVAGDAPAALQDCLAAGAEQPIHLHQSRAECLQPFVEIVAGQVL